jgi:two-component system, NtrC family, response regulator GlrR
MQRPRILLYDLCSPSDLGNIVLEFLKSSGGENCHPLRGAAEIQRYSSASDPLLGGALSDFKPDVICMLLSGISLDRAKEGFATIHRAKLTVPVFAVVEKGKPQDMLELLKLGAADFVTPPLKQIEILPRVWRLLERTNQLEKVPEQSNSQFALDGLIGQSCAFRAQAKRIPLAGSCDAGVLIIGKTGTGKELFARAIHQLSPRADKPFIAVNCGAIPVDLAENELFGHEQGAFTGASRSQPGLVQEADGGTLFLDEIAGLHPLVQVKLLRFLQEKEYRPLGSTKARSVDVRVIGAANVDLEQLVGAGKFRADLFYRLNILSFQLPSLAERREDIPLLAFHFLAKYSSRFGRNITSFSTGSMQKLMRYDWPGNVRELEYSIERSVVFSQGAVIQETQIFLPGEDCASQQSSFKEAKAARIAQFEKTYLLDVLSSCNGNITQAARVARKNRRAFWQLVRKHQIDVDQFRPGTDQDKRLST